MADFKYLFITNQHLIILFGFSHKLKQLSIGTFTYSLTTSNRSVGPVKVAKTKFSEIFRALSPSTEENMKNVCILTMI